MPDTIDHGSLNPGVKAAAPCLETGEGDESSLIKPLTRQEAQALRARHPPLSPWVVLGLQSLAGLMAAVAAWVWRQQSSAVWSALYGAAIVVIPGVLMARGMTRQQHGKAPAELLVRFFVWEFAKVITALALLAGAVKAVPGLNWPVLLVTMIVSLKMNWLALLWWRPSPTRKQEEIQKHVR